MPKPNGEAETSPGTERFSTLARSETAKRSIRASALIRVVCAQAARKVARMASTGRELLGGHYDDEHLTYEEISGLGLKVVTEDGETIPTDDIRGKIFRIVDRDDASGYVVSPTESTGTATLLCYLQAP